MSAAGPRDGVVRPAAAADAEAIAAVHVDTWRHAYAGLMPDEILDGLDVSQRAQTWRGILASPPDGVIVLVFERDGEVRGFVSAGPHRAGRASGEVFAIYVDPPCQGLGGTEQSWTHHGIGEGLTEVRYVTNLRPPAGP